MKRVLAGCCGAYILAQLAVSYLPSAAFGPLAAVFVVCFIVLWLMKQPQKWCVLCICALVGLMSQAASQRLIAQPVLCLQNTTQNLTVQVIEIQPGYSDDRYIVRLQVLAQGAAKISYPKRFYLHCEDFPETALGRIYTGNFELNALKKDNYYYSNLASRVWLRAEGAENLMDIGSQNSLLLQLKRLQQQLAANVTRYLPQKEGGVLAAMSVGWKGNLQRELKNSYRAAGVSHLLVVSGLHLTVLCGCLFVGRAQGTSRRIRAFVALMLVGFVMGLTGFSPSVCRAGAAAILFYVGIFLRLPADGLTSLALAGFLASLGGPYALCDVGLQLSFMATLGVMLAANCTVRLKYSVKNKGIAKRAAVNLYSLVLTSIFAALFTLPVQCINNFEISVWVPLTNIITSFLVAPVVIFGLLAAVCGLSPRLTFWARLVSLLGGLTVKGMNWIIQRIAALPGARLQPDTRYLLFVWVVGFALGALLFKLNKRRWLWAVLPCIAAVSLVLYSAQSKGLVRIETIGTPANACVVVQQSGHTAVVFQGGERNTIAVNEYMQRKGISELDVLVDLRQAPADVAILAKVYLVPKAQNEQQTITMCDIIITSIPLKTGNLLVLDVAGYKISALTGSLVATDDFATDVFFGGRSAPGSLQAHTIVASSPIVWHANYNATCCYGENTTLLIRPGQAIKIKGSQYAVQ